jgi:hypothetical protein
MDEYVDTTRVSALARLWSAAPKCPDPPSIRTVIIAG